MKKTLDTNAFTLIEVLVVVSIIAVLLAISFFSLEKSRQAARDAKRKGDLELIRTALEDYWSNCKDYPASLNWGGSFGGCPGYLYITHLDPVPNDPITQYTYYYRRNGSNSYILCSVLEDSTAPPIDCGGDCDPSNAIPCRHKVINARTQF